MAHRMGLANIKMGSATAANSKETLTLSANTTTVAYSTSTTNNAFYALDEFETNLPYKVGIRNTSGLCCYFIVKPSNSYTFSTPYKYSDSYRQWNNITVSSSSNAIAAGKYRNLSTSTPKFKNLGRLYSYTGTCQTYTPIIKNVKYKMECWGADGGLAAGSTKAGAGGYSYGTKSLSSNAILYVAVGQEGTWSKYSTLLVKGWNGGGPGGIGGAGGGGCTHIATVTGQLKDLSSQKSAVLIVAGGGAGNDNGSDEENVEYGAGGGTYGGNGSLRNDQLSSPKGGGPNAIGGENIGLTTYSGTYIQTNPSFGQGGGGSGDNDYGGAGGGGWYGGAGGLKAGFGGGGSGHLDDSMAGNTYRGDIGGNTIPLPTAASGYKAGKYVATKDGSGNYIPGNSHNGYARITLLPYD